ncbi:MspA family porin [Prescottella defluvii]|uniref:MspA family porin n=1 Tax=Prescottella defluvii TaxID=1323361 RepID=UPI0004F26A9A|nr:MspA family porin [Prescottella defluvii]
MHVNHRSFLRRRLTRSASAVIAGAAAVMLTVSVGSAGAEATFQENTSAHAVSFDGWELHIDQTGQSINSVPPLSGNQFTRDIFASGRALATVSGNGGSPYTGGILEVGYQIGYQADVSNGAVITGNAGVTPGAVFVPEVGETLILTADPAVPAAVELFNGQALELGVETPVEGNLSTQVAPGTIATVPVQKKECKSTQCAITLRDVHLEVNHALGTVSVRSYAIFTASTDLADDVVVSYGPPVIV